MRLSLKSKTEVCALYVFPLILYRLAVLSSAMGMSAGNPSIPHQITLGRPKADGQ